MIGYRNIYKKVRIIWLFICTAVICVGCVRHSTGEEVCNSTHEIFAFFNENKEIWADYFRSLPNGVVPALETESPYGRFVVYGSGNETSQSEIYVYHVVESHEHPLTPMGTMGLVYVPSGVITRRSGLSRFELTLIQDNVYCYRRP